MVALETCRSNIPRLLTRKFLFAYRTQAFLPSTSSLASGGISGTVIPCRSTLPGVEYATDTGSEARQLFSRVPDEDQCAPHLSWGMELPFAVRGVKTYSEASSKQAKDRVSSISASDVEGMKVVKLHEKREERPGEEIISSSYWGFVPKKFTREDGSEWTWNSFKPSDCYNADTKVDLKRHFQPLHWSDKVAYRIVKFMRIPTDIFFQRRYGCRAMMLETVAAVPGMVAGMLLHLRSLRRFEHSGGWIKALLEEAENERMHLMTFMEVAQPRWYERALVLAVQGIFFNVYFVTYILSPRVAHRIVGYLEEEAVHSYTEYIKDIDAGKIKNVPAPQIAIDYWRLPKNATLRDVCEVVRADEAHHRDVNHFAGTVMHFGKDLKDNPAPVDYH